MATVISQSGNLIWSATEPLPIEGFPPGRIKFRMRPENFVFAYVKTDAGIVQYAVKEVGGKWMPAFEMARNVCVESQPAL